LSARTTPHQATALILLKFIPVPMLPGKSTIMVMPMLGLLRIIW